MKRKENIVFGNLSGGDIFVLREKIENETVDVFIKLIESPYNNAIRLCDGWSYVFPEEVKVIKLKLK